MKTHYDVIAFGGCYLDINASNLAFGNEGVPVEKEIRGTEYESLPGGSGVNFIRALHRLRRSGLFIGMRGDDPVGTLIEQLCTQEGLAVRLITAPGKRSNIGLNMIGVGGGHTVFSIGSANQALNAEILLPALVGYLDAGTYVYMGTLYKLDGLAADFPLIISSVRAKNAKIVVDHGTITPGVSRERFEQVKKAVLQADYYLPSRAEFLETWHVKTIEDGLTLLAKQAPTLKVVVKDGSQGAHYLENGFVRTIPAPAVASAPNATGAGDTFNAGLINGLLAGTSLPDAISSACQLAARHVSKTLV